MIDQKTDYLKLPLPHRDNVLDEDLPRLRTALSRMDAHAKAADEALTAKAEAADVENALANLDAALEAKAEASAVENALANLDTALDAKADKTHEGVRASTSDLGHVRLATDEEAAAGTDAAKAVTPRQLKAARDAGADPDRDDRSGSYTSAGSPEATGFKLADDTDIAEIFGKLDDVENATTGGGSFVTDVALSVNGKNVRLTRNMGTPGHCSYCTYCNHCSHCSYCKYCSYCGIACGD
ncbi:MAG: hypothetical protein K2O70_09685 [Desulfovibrionaceae bacterium]|nr:hypothetical protein [Desulfovibrionaceae bacterium]